MKNKVLIILTAIMLLLFFMSITTGSMSISFPFKNSTEKVIFMMRLQGGIFALLLGGLLSLSGYLYQLVFANPLTDPFIIGVSHICAIGAVISFTYFKWATGYQVIFSIFLAVIYILLFYIVLVKFGFQRNREKFLLLGLGFNIIFSSVLTFILLQSQQLSQIMFWMMGSLNKGNWTNIIVLSSVLLITILIMTVFKKNLFGLHFDEDIVRTSGIDYNKGKIVAFITASIITAFCVSYAGIIGFVGLIIPNIGRKYFYTDILRNMLYNIIAGGSLLLLADVISRVWIRPIILPVGIVTGIIGGIFFISLLFLSNKQK